MNKLKAFVAGVLCLSASLQAATQTKDRICGKVIDSSTGKPVGWATVALMRSDSTIISGTTTDENGVYELNAANGDYILNVSLIGYSPVFKAQKIDAPAMSLEDIKIDLDTQMLENAVVTERIPMVEMQADKLVVNISQSAFAQGSNAMELIKKAPGVVVDKDANITLNGKHVAIWIDGRPSYLDGKNLEALLVSTTGESIEKFELMEHPSSKYDAAGQGGIINIKTKKNTLSGLNGSIGVNGGGMYFKETGSFIWNESAWANLNYRSAKTNTFLNLSQGIYNYALEMEIDNSVKYGESGESVYRQHSLSQLAIPYNNYQVKFGNDWFIDKKNTLGFILSFPVSLQKISGPAEKGYSKEYIDDVLVEESQANVLSKEDQKQVNANLNYTYVINEEKNSEITANLDYYRTKTDASTDQDSYTRYLNDTVWYPSTRDIISHNLIDIYSAKLDYQTMIQSKGMLEAGAKWATSTTGNNMSRVETGLEPFSEDTRFSYLEHIGALYCSYAASFGTKWSLKAGLRGEYTYSLGDWTSQGTKTERSYFDVFPTLFVTYTPSEKWRFNLSYTRRINRPHYGQLDPMVVYVDAHNYIVGNPDLLPEYNDGVGLQFGFGKYLGWSIGYDYTKNLITQNPSIDEKGNEKLEWGNFGYRHMGILTFNVSELPIAKWLDWTLNLTGLYIKNVSTKDGMTNAKPFLDAYTCFTFNLPKNWKIQLDGNYSTTMTWGYLVLRPQGQINLGIKKKMLNDKLILSFDVDDLCRTAKQNVDLVGVSGMISGYLGQKYFDQKVRIGLSWNFGTAQQTKARNVGNLEESSRVGSSKIGQ